MSYILHINTMICQSKISTFCKKRFKKSQVKHIWVDNKPLEVCSNCFWKLKQRAKQKNGRPQSGDHMYKLKGFTKSFQTILSKKRAKKVGKDT